MTINILQIDFNTKNFTFRGSFQHFRPMQNRKFSTPFSQISPSRHQPKISNRTTEINPNYISNLITRINRNFSLATSFNSQFTIHYSPLTSPLWSAIRSPTPTSHLPQACRKPSTTDIYFLTNLYYTSLYLLKKFRERIV